MSERKRVEVVRPAWSLWPWRLGSLPESAPCWVRALPDAAEANAAHHLLTPPPLSELTTRVRRVLDPQPWDVDVWRFKVGASGTLDGISSAEEFCGVAVEDGPVEAVRSYNVDGHHRLQILVPERYAAQLDLVREWRLRDEAGLPTSDLPPVDGALLDRALPEDLVPALDALPGEQVRTIVLSDEPHPLDAWFSRMGGEGHTTVMDVDSRNSDGSVTYHRLQRPDPIESDLRHAWAHLVPKELLRADESTIWTLAVPLEEWDDVTSDWEALAQDVEYHLHNEEILVVLLADVALHPDSERLSALATAAPVRTLALGRALRWTIDSSPPRSKLGPHLAETRVQQIEEQARDRALDRLVALATGPGRADPQTAAQLLILLQEGARLRNVAGPASLTFQFYLDPETWYLEQMQGWTWLRTLDLSYSKIEDDALRPLPEIGPIERLAIHGSVDRRPPYLTVFKWMPSLKHLDLGLWHGWSDTEKEIWVFTLDNLTWLETLTLPHSSVSERALEELRSALPNTTITLR